MSQLAPSRHRPEIIRAIEQGNSRVTIGDVAIATGWSVWLVERALMSLAVDAGGHLQVAKDGEIIYVFPVNLQAILLGRRGWEWVVNVMRKAGKVILYLVRISFGIILIGLTVAVALALGVVLIFLSQTGSDAEGLDLSSLFDSSILEAFFWFDPSPLLAGLEPSEPGPKGQAIPSQRKLTFLQAIYSLLFGEGNPNADLEERRWRLIASLIRRERGVVIAEQLMPYLDQRDAGLASEDDVLPVLVRFNGQPHVSPEGDLVYGFPDLQLTAQGQKRKETGFTIEDSERNDGGSQQSWLKEGWLKEHHWRFSLASQAQKTGAGWLVMLLLLFSLALSASVTLFAASLPVWSALLAGVATAGLIYGSACCLLPLCRYLWLLQCNAGVAKRNALRRQRAERLKLPSRTISRKLGFARQYAGQRTVAASELVYTTEKDLLTQELDNHEAVAADWQQRLNGKSPFDF